MNDTRQLEMKLHKYADNISRIENKLDNVMKMIQELNAKLDKPLETVPVDRNYRGFSK